MSWQLAAVSGWFGPASSLAWLHEAQLVRVPCRRLGHHQEPDPRRVSGGAQLHAGGVRGGVWRIARAVIPSLWRDTSACTISHHTPQQTLPQNYTLIASPQRLRPNLTHGYFGNIEQGPGNALGQSVRNSQCLLPVPMHTHGRNAADSTHTLMSPQRETRAHICKGRAIGLGQQLLDNLPDKPPPMERAGPPWITYKEAAAEP